MPERFKVVCIPCKALYKCSAFTFTSWTSLVKLSSGPDVTYGLFRQQLKGHLFLKYEHGALRLLICGALEKHLLYILTGNFKNL